MYNRQQNLKNIVDNPINMIDIMLLSILLSNFTQHLREDISDQYHLIDLKTWTMNTVEEVEI